MDYANECRQKLIASVPTSHECKRIAAIEYLAERHVFHPEYKFHPRHGLSSARMQHSVLAPVEKAARKAGRI